MKADIESLSNTMPRAKWIKRIEHAWEKWQSAAETVRAGMLESIFETGTLLETAKEELRATHGYGEWAKMVQNDLPFTKRMADMLIVIATNDNLRDGNHGSHLPGHWRTLYELTKLTDEQFKKGIQSGAINPNMQRKDVKTLCRIETKPRKKKAAVGEARQPEPKTLKGWIDEIGPQIEIAYKALPENDRLALLAGLMETFAVLEPDAYAA
jgi:hypothetical protein